MQEQIDTLVIGGTGLVGSHLLWQLSETTSVIASSRNSAKRDRVRQLFLYYDPKNGEERFKRIHWINLDILDLDALVAAIAPVARVYHCAALVSFHRIDFYRCIKMNREGTANVVNACLQNPNVRLCYVSSTAAVGTNPKGEITEDCLWKASDKNSGYSVSKFGAEKEVWRGIQEGLNAVIINPCTVIGAGVWGEGSMEMFSVAKKGLLFYPSGENATVDARDLAASMVFLMDSSISNARFLCIGSNQTFLTLFAVIAKNMNKKPPRFFIPRWVALPVSYFTEFISLILKRRRGMTIESARAAYSIRIYSAKKLQDLLNNPFHSLEDSVRNAINGQLKS